MRLILASASPRRAALLTQGGFSFETRVPQVQEILPAGVSVGAAAESLAQQKGLAAERRAGELLLAADTVVALDGELLGKPQDAEQAKAMLRRLSGRTHTVSTGVFLQSDTARRVFSESTAVTFFPLTEAEIDAYVQSGEPMDKAGAYGIQGLGALLVEKIEGDYNTVVGLPLAKTAKIIKEMQLL